MYDPFIVKGVLGLIIANVICSGSMKGCSILQQNTHSVDPEIVVILLFS